MRIAKSTPGHELDHWFASLGYRQTFTKPFISIELGGDSGNELDGFEVANRNGRIKALTIRLTTEAYQTVNGERIAPISFEDWVKCRFWFYEKVCAHDLRVGGRDSVYQDITLECYVLSRACEARGEPALANQLLQFAKKDSTARKEDFAPTVRSGVEDSEIYQLYLNFEDRDLSRKQLITVYESFLKRFPTSSHAALARSEMVALRATISERFSTARGLTLQQETIAGKVFALRDHFGSTTDPYRGVQNGPFPVPGYSPDDLESIESEGYAAVPQLIMGLKNNAMTRNAAYCQGNLHRMVVLRAGDVCERILEHIAHRSFAPDNVAAMQDDPYHVEAVVNQWWSEVCKGAGAAEFGKEPSLGG